MAGIPSYFGSCRWRDAFGFAGVYKSSGSPDGLLEKGRGAAWCALVDGTELHVESDGIDGLRQLISYHVFYTAEFLQQEC